MVARKRKETEIDIKLAEFEAKLRAELGVPVASEAAAGSKTAEEELEPVL
jgi:hypothetical protein